MWATMISWVWHDRTHRILIYIALVLTLSLAVEVFNFSLVGK